MRVLRLGVRGEGLRVRVVRVLQYAWRGSLSTHDDGPRVRRVVRVRLGLRSNQDVYIIHILYIEYILLFTYNLWQLFVVFDRFLELGLLVVKHQFFFVCLFRLYVCTLVLKTLQPLRTKHKHSKSSELQTCLFVINKF